MAFLKWWGCGTLSKTASGCSFSWVKILFAFDFLASQRLLFHPRKAPRGLDPCPWWSGQRVLHIKMKLKIKIQIKLVQFLRLEKWSPGRKGASPLFSQTCSESEPKSFLLVVCYSWLLSAPTGSWEQVVKFSGILYAAIKPLLRTKLHTLRITSIILKIYKVTDIQNSSLSRYLTTVYNIMCSWVISTCH